MWGMELKGGGDIPGIFLENSECIRGRFSNEKRYCEMTNQKFYKRPSEK